jgi:hypothetical protein
MALSKDETAPFMFSKVDLKDGYWRMAVNAEDAWNFAYVLPGGKPGDSVQLVIPDALQMGWSESPPFFCAATETARDVLQADMDTNKHVTEQPMEDIMMNIDWASIPKHSEPSNSGPDKTKFLKLVEVYIDDFIGVLQSTDEVELRQLSRKILKGINNVFPPSALTGSTMGPSVLEKKLIEDGTWALRKEVLGWLFDGLAQTIELP